MCWLVPLAMLPGLTEIRVVFAVVIVTKCSMSRFIRGSTWRLQACSGLCVQSLARWIWLVDRGKTTHDMICLAHSCVAVMMTHGVRH
jgi:hypothetical protein